MPDLRATVTQDRAIASVQNGGSARVSLTSPGRSA
jgi:hypothetical protein